MKAVTFNNVTKTFGDVTAVKNSHINVEKGEVFGFLGPNGAGKTTSIRCLMDFIRPDEGNITVLGLDAQKDSVELKKKIGYLSADNHLHLDWTGQQHIDFVAQMRGLKSGDSKIVEKLGLNPTIPVKNLSSGNKQKLAIVLCFLGNPELVVLDEPTQGLDPILQNQFYSLLAEFTKNGGTVFMSSHNLVEVERICSRVAIINKGKIVNEETLESLKAKSLHRISVTYQHNDASKIAKITGSEIIASSPNTLVIKAKGNLNAIITTIGKFPIKDLEITHANLDEIFLEYYHD